MLRCSQFTFNLEVFYIMNHNSHFSSIEINLVSFVCQGNEKNVDQNKNLKTKWKNDNEKFAT